MEKIGLELRNLMNLIVRYTHKDVIKSDLSMPQGAIIKYLKENNDKAIHPSDLESIFMMRKSTLSRMLKLMSDNGYIEVMNDDIDLRKKVIKLTSKSISLYDSMGEKIEYLENLLIQNLDDKDIDLFLKVIEQMKRNLIDEMNEVK